jgi:hypothetical protein
MRGDDGVATQSRATGEGIMPDEITLNGKTYVAKNNRGTNDDDLKYVIVRCKDAGVHAGFLRRVNEADNTVDLVDSRRLWRWHGRTLSGLAIEGTDDQSRCKFGDEVDITLAGWCEIIPCTEDAMKSLRGIAGWEND